MGAAVIFMAYAFGNRSGITLDLVETTTSSIPTGSSSITSRLFPLISIVLVVLLGIVALIANRVEHARDAAERAKTEAKDVSAKGEILVLTSRLLERMQAATHGASDLLEQAYETGGKNQTIVRTLNLGASGLSGMARFFSSLHQWMLEPHLISTDDLVNRAAALKPILRELNQIDTIGINIRNRRQRLRMDHWQPAARLLENLLKSIHTPHFSNNISPSELQTAFEVLREVYEELNRL